MWSNVSNKPVLKGVLYKSLHLNIRSVYRMALWGKLSFLLIEVSTSRCPSKVPLKYCMQHEKLTGEIQGLHADAGLQYLTGITVTW